MTTGAPDLTTGIKLTSASDENYLALDVFVQVLGRNELLEKGLGVVVEGEEEDLDDEDHVLDDLFVVDHLEKREKKAQN